MTLTLSPEIEEVLTKAAARQGTTPAQIVTQIVQEKFAVLGETPDKATEEEPTLAEALVGHIGTQQSGRGDLSQNTGKAFARLMVEKRKAGRL